MAMMTKKIRKNNRETNSPNQKEFLLLLIKGLGEDTNLLGPLKY